MKSFLSLLFLIAFTQCFSQQLVSSELLPCNNDAEDIYRERISAQRWSNDTLYLEINIKANCASELIPELKNINDSLIISIKNSSKIYAACNCCYTMHLVVTNEIQNKVFKLLVNKKELKFSKSRYIDVPPPYISEEWLKNEFTSHGLRKGYWKTKEDKGNYRIDFYGDEPSKDGYPVWSKSFNKKGAVLTVTVSEGNYFIDVNIKKYKEIIQEQYANINK